MSKENAEGENSEGYGKKLGKIVDEFGLGLDDDDLAFLKDEDEEDTEELIRKVKEMSLEIKNEEEKQIKNQKDLEADAIMDKIGSYYDYYRDAKEDKDSDDYEPALKPVDTPVYLNYKAYKRMVGYAQRYADEDKSMKHWKEVYGILIGEVQEKTLVVIKNAIPLKVGGPTGVELEDMHYVDLSEIDNEIWENSVENKKTDFIVGWWHTHPGFGFFFSEVDTYTHLGYQIANPFAVGLIFDHCEKNPKTPLGVAGIRLTDPNDGLRTDFKIIKNLHYDDDVKYIIPKIEKTIKNIKKNMPEVIQKINYIKDTLRKRGLSQLQRNHGLLMVDRKDVKVAKGEYESDDLEERVYTWDPDFKKKTKRIPKFLEKMRNEILKYESLLRVLYEEGETKQKKFENRREKFREKINKLLEKPIEKYEYLRNRYEETIEVIYPFQPYLDTDERKIIENFEEDFIEYGKILDELKEKAEFNIDNK